MERFLSLRRTKQSGNKYRNFIFITGSPRFARDDGSTLSQKKDSLARAGPFWFDRGIIWENKKMQEKEKILFTFSIFPVIQDITF